MKLPALLALAALSLSAAQASEKNTELESLRSGWKSAKAAAVAPLDQKYRQALVALRDRLAKAGRLDEAVAVESEAKALSSDSSTDGHSRWMWGSGGTLTLMEGGVAKHSAWSKPGSWAKMHNGSIALVSDTGVAFSITFAEDGTGKVKSFEGGNVTTIKPQ